VAGEKRTINVSTIFKGDEMYRTRLQVTNGGAPGKVAGGPEKEVATIGKIVDNDIPKMFYNITNCLLSISYEQSSRIDAIKAVEQDSVRLTRRKTKKRVCNGVECGY
jgi:hypothetical protein